MSLHIRVSGRIGRPVAEVFDAVVNPAKLSGYFTTIGGASAPLVEGTVVTWWKDEPVEVDRVVLDRIVGFRWRGGKSDDGSRYQTAVEMTFEPLDDGGTMVTIAESGWHEDPAGRCASYLNCEGWTQMLCCMKAYTEHGINLRDGMYLSEMRGEPASEANLERNS